MNSKRVDLKKRFEESINNKFNWKEIVALTEREEIYEERRATYLGSVMSLFPSGKFYACWTTNQTATDVVKDEAFGEVLNEIARKHGGWIETGLNGDLTDVFFCLPIPDEDDGNNRCDRCLKEMKSTALVWITAEDFEPNEGEVVTEQMKNAYDALCEKCYIEEINKVVKEVRI